jgi:hypothetical protein
VVKAFYKSRNNLKYLNNIDDNNSSIRIIYIAGYGHSGSTILEILLSCSKNIFGLGELVGIPRELNASFTKSFLKKYQFCSDLYERTEKALASKGESMESIRELNQCEHLFGRRNKALKKRYNEFWSTFLKTAKNDPNQSILGFVDSSKTSLAHAYRPYLLQQNPDFNVSVVHIVRHPKSVLWRHKKKATLLSKYEEPEWMSQTRQLFKTTLNWGFSNIWPVFLSNKFHKYVRISHEELCEFPVETLEKIQKECKLDLCDTIDRVKNNKPLPPTCGIAGNIPVKKQEKELRFEPSKKTVPKTGPILSILSLLLLPIYKFLTR